MRNHLAPLLEKTLCECNRLPLASRAYVISATSDAGQHFLLLSLTSFNGRQEQFQLKPTTTIGVNRPAIVREIPQFCLFPAFPHFCENVPHFWLYFEITKISENRNNFTRTDTFCSKKLKKNTTKIAENRNKFHCRRHFVRKSSAKTPMIASHSHWSSRIFFIPC